MLVCNEHKFIFLRNPKTASRSLSNFFKKYFNVNEITAFHSTEIPELYSDYLVIATVRNPYSRAVSGWQHWIKKQLSGQTSFDFFLDPSTIVTDDDGNHHMESWKNQSDVLEKFSHKIILQYETLHKDLIALPFINEVELPKIGVQNYNNWKDYYTLALAEKVYNLFKKDFEMFGYKRWEISLL